MKKTSHLVGLSLCMFLLSIMIGKAQVITKGFTNPALKTFQNSKTYVVLTGNETFDTWLRSAMDKHWMVAPVQYINSGSELDTLVRSDKNVFFFPQTKDDKSAAMHLLTGSEIEAKKDITFMLSIGGFKQTKYMFTPATGGTKIIASFKFSPERAEITAGMYEAEILIAFMNQCIQTILDNHIKSEVKDSVKIMITNNAVEMKDKTLLFNSVYSDGTIELEKKAIINEKSIDSYEFGHQIVNKFNLDSIISTGNTCYLLLYFPSNYVNQADDSGDIIVYDNDTKKILYFDDNYYGPWLDRGELRDIEYAAKGKM